MKLLHEAFEARAARTPEALALVAGTERLTYGELDARAGRLAARLAALGVGPEVRVGVCLGRSASMVEGLLAVLKAGGAYVPLDPSYPGARLAFMLEDSGAAVLLTEERWLDRLPGGDGGEGGARRVLLAGQPEAAPEAAPGGGSADGRAPSPSPGNLAYVIYTSGSTGRPKGVAIEHRSAAALVRWAAGAFAPEELAGVLASTSICFDLSIFEIFVPLSLGGAVILADHALDLPFLPAAAEVTLVNTVPSAMAELVRSGWVPPSVRVANLAGEALPRPLVAEIYRTTAVRRVLNLYGPTEDTTYSTWAEVERDGLLPPPIGQPLPGTRAALLGAGGEPVPPGEEGELFLAGDGLARGYLGRPELTAERFVPDPAGISSGASSGARLYRTGDLARALPDGSLQFLGRADQQVKVRGFRVELGEIEAALARHPAVREAAVTAAGDGRLVAWLATDGPEPELPELPEIAELRSFLAAALPDFMIPTRFRRLAALPRTLNGKLDRRALSVLAGPLDGAALPAAPAGLAPLSFAQQRLWLVERLQPGEPTYNEPWAVDLCGPLERPALAAALGEVVRRHPALRTRYVEVDGTPFQEAVEPLPVALPLVDLAALPAPRRERELDRALRAEVRRTFDLGRPPLLRPLLLRRGPSEQTLAMTFHHIAYDGRSEAIFMRDLSALYAAARDGRPPALPEPALAPAELARRQRAAWRGIPAAALAQQRRRLAGTPALELPGDRPRPPLRSPRGVAVRVELAAELVAPLRALAVAAGATFFHALLAAFAALLGRAAGRSRGVIGTTAAGRGAPESRELMGFFVNLLPLPLDLSGRPGLGALAARVGEVVRAAAAAQDEVPFQQLVAALEPERNASRDAFFQVLFQLRPPLGIPDLAGIEARRRPVATGTAKLDLEMSLWESEGGLGGYCEASADLYDRATVQRLVERYRTLLAAAVAEPQRPLDELPLLAAAERHELVVEWSAAGGGRHYVLEAGMEPAPVGVPGELCLAVDQVVADGYPDAPDKTAERFVPDPFSGRAGGRLFRTGRRARRLATGGLELLDAPEPAAPAPRAGARPTPAGEILARIWCEVLGLESVTPDDNFFHLGGHSLLGARVLSRVREAFGVDLPMRVLFRAPTTHALAGVVDEALRGGAPPPQPVRRVPRTGPLPLSFAQERLWLHERLAPASALYNVPLALRLSGRLAPAALAAALREVGRRHEALATRFLEVAGTPLQEVVSCAAPELARVDLAALPEEARAAALARLARSAATTPFDLGRAPLFSSRLVRLGVDEHALLLTFHHLVFDGWSQGVLGRELSALYDAALEGRPSPLPDLPVQFADFAVRQREWLTGETLERLRASWRCELEGAPSVLELPTDRPRPSVRAFRGARERAELPAALGEGIADLGRREGTTRFMVLLAAFQALLHHLTGQEDLLVGSPVGGRPRPELEGLIGMFVDTLVLRGRLDGDPSFRELLGRARETALRAWAHQELPFEHLVAGLRAERGPSHEPIQAVLRARTRSARASPCRGSPCSRSTPAGRRRSST